MNEQLITDDTLSASTRRVDLHRRVALIGPRTILVRPSRRALLRPLSFFVFGLASALTIWLGLSSLPLLLLAVLLLCAVVFIPLAGIGLMYGLIGAHVVIDADKQSATWQQGMIGLGLGTQELVPFGKIAAITVEEAGAAREGSGAPTEEFAQWQIVLEKRSGKRLVIGQASAARRFQNEAYDQARTVAEAIATMCGAPLALPPAATPPAAEPPPPVTRPRRGARRRPQRRTHR